MFSTVLIFVIIFAYIFEFINGFHDTANAIATSVYTKALTPKRTILLAACMNFVGALVSEKVAMTISQGIVEHMPRNVCYNGGSHRSHNWNLFTCGEGYPAVRPMLLSSLIGASIVFTAGPEHHMERSIRKSSRTTFHITYYGISYRLSFMKAYSKYSLVVTEKK
jgi:PiT family inorganic phosphate transporter